MSFTIGEKLTIIARDTPTSPSREVVVTIIQIEPAFELLFGKGWQNIYV